MIINMSTNKRVVCQSPLTADDEPTVYIIIINGKIIGIVFTAYLTQILLLFRAIKRTHFII